MRTSARLIWGIVPLLAASCTGLDEDATEEIETETSAISVGNMHEGETLFQGQQIVAKNCYFRATMQLDGNLVIYGGPGHGNPIWATGTNPGGARAVLQTDNNFVVYSLGGTALWASNTGTSIASSARLAMQNDGNLVMYIPNGPLWASNTARAPQSWPCNEVEPTEVTRVEQNVDRPGSDLPGMPLRPPVLALNRATWCGNECARSSSCRAFTHVTANGGECWLKSAHPPAIARSGMVSGLKLTAP